MGVPRLFHSRSSGIDAAAHDFSEAFSSQGELRPLAEAALERLLHHLPADSGAIVLTAGERPLVTRIGRLPDAGRRTVPIAFKRRQLGTVLLPAPASPAREEERLLELFAGAFGAAVKRTLA